MGALGYLISRSIKNNLLSLKKHPGRLVGLIAIVLLLVFVLVTGHMTQGEANSGGLAIWLRSILIGGGLLLFLFGWYQGLSRGTTFFSMSDVNFLFVSPVSGKAILGYGMIGQLGRILIWFLVLLFQATTLQNLFGITSGTLAILALFFFLLLATQQVVTMDVYLVSTRSGRGKRVCTILFYGMVALLLALAAPAFLRGTNPLESLRAYLESPLFQWLPIPGIGAQSVVYAQAGQWGMSALFLVLSVAVLAVVMFIGLQIRSDYYEDVLAMTERRTALLQAKREGNGMEVNLPSNSRRKVKAAKGLGGWGASALMARQIREISRRGFLIFDKQSLMVIIMGVAFSLFLSRNLEDGIILASFSFLAYMAMLFSFSSSWMMELQKPYVFLVPANARAKTFMCMLPGILKSTLEGAVVFVVVGIVTRSPVLDLAAAILTYGAISFLFQSVTLLAERLFGELRKAAVVVMLMMVLDILIALPGIVAMVVLSTLGMAALGMLAFMAWGLLIAAILILSCGGVLHNMEGK